MSKTWYPVIDYLTCTECSICIDKCPQGVYDVTKAPCPVVVNPTSCVDHCHGCGNVCPVGAITYVGDNTGWTPLGGSQKVEESCCSCGSCEPSNKKVLVEYLYLDLKTCDRCIGTDVVLKDVMATLTPALEFAGYTVEYCKTEITTAELAMQYEFLSSPTIRVNGQDICQTVSETSCGCCSEISDTDVDCRVFEYDGEKYEIPPKEKLADNILRSVFGTTDGSCSCGSYELPDNLRAFFDGKKNKKCSCGGDCC